MYVYIFQCNKSICSNIFEVIKSDLLVDPVLVDGPHCGHVRVEELSERHLLAAGARADQPRLPNRVVAHQHALHQLLDG